MDGKNKSLGDLSTNFWKWEVRCPCKKCRRKKVLVDDHIIYLRLATPLDEIMSGKPVTTSVTNPIGCNVKWQGKDAHWMPAEACDLI